MCKVLQETGSLEKHFLLLTSLLSNLVQDQFPYNINTFRPIRKRLLLTLVFQTVIDLTHPGGGGSPWLTVFGEWWPTAGGAGEATWLSAAEPRERVGGECSGAAVGVGPGT